MYKDDNEFRFNDASNHESHLRQNGILTWFGIETAIMICLIYAWKYKTRTNSKLKYLYFVKTINVF